MSATEYTVIDVKPGFSLLRCEVAPDRFLCSILCAACSCLVHEGLPPEIAHLFWQEIDQKSPMHPCTVKPQVNLLLN